MISIFMFTKTPALCEEGEAIKLKICINLARAEERMDLFWFIWRHKQQKYWGQVIIVILFRVEHSHWYRSSRYCAPILSRVLNTIQLLKNRFLMVNPPFLSPVKCSASDNGALEDWSQRFCHKAPEVSWCLELCPYHLLHKRAGVATSWSRAIRS